MKFTYHWLKKWLDLDLDIEKISNTLTMLGLEVDKANDIFLNIKKVIVGKVIDVKKHPKADRLNICLVDTGSEKLSIICGANNVKENIKVPVAIPGAKLGDIKIKKTKIRDEYSFGMICSKQELGLEEKSEGIFILNDNAPIGENIKKYLNLDDYLIELDITPNRGDCLSILGIARELSAKLDLPIIDNIKVNNNNNNTSNLTINTTISNPEACPRFLTRVLTNIDNNIETPDWIKEKLLKCGQHIISAVVDITNYVMLEIGTPMHAYKLSKINDTINVRFAKKNEKILLINNKEVILNEDDLVIADKNKAIGLAGIMGGISTSITKESKDIILEAAFFNPEYIIGKARKYAISSEASHRFERGIDFMLQQKAIEYASELILNICGGKAHLINEKINKKYLPQRANIELPLQLIERIIGFDIDKKWIKKYLINLGFKLVGENSSSFTFLVPSYRFDIKNVEDIIEEIARGYDYSKIPNKEFSFTRDDSIEENNTFNIARQMTYRNYKEVINYSFISKDWHYLVSPNKESITIKNYISDEKECMRTSLWPGLIITMMENIKYNIKDHRYFEIGNCFYDANNFQQTYKIAALISGCAYSNSWCDDTKEVNFYDIKGDVETILKNTNNECIFEKAQHNFLQTGQTARIISKNKAIGWIGALSSEICVKYELKNIYLFELDIKYLFNIKPIKYSSYSKQQISTRDLSIIVKKYITSYQIITIIKKINQLELLDIKIFDVYEGENIKDNERSLGIRLYYQSNKKITNNEIDVKVEEIIKSITNKLEAKLREN